MVIKHQGRNIRPDSLNVNKFVGYNTVDDPSNLGSGYLVEGSKNIDLARERGSLGKALGRAALITSLGSGGITGLHNFQHSGGDVPLFGHGTSLYKLTGTSLTLPKTTAADFNAGTMSNARTFGDAVVLNSPDASLTAIKILDTDDSDLTDWNLTPTNPLGQTFTLGADAYQNNISLIKANLGSTSTWGSGENITMSLYTDTTKATLLGSVTVNGPYSEINNLPSFPLVVAGLTSGGQYYLEFTLNTGLVAIKYTNTVYAGGVGYQNGVAQTGEHLQLEVYCKAYYTSGTYTSQSLDLAQTPATATLAWTEIVPANTAIAMQVRGSDDSTNWGDWQTVLTGGAVPRKRFVQVKATLTTTDTTVTPTLSDFTITYTTAYDAATMIPQYTDDFSASGKWVLAATGGTATISGGVLTLISDGSHSASGNLEMYAYTGGYSIEMSVKRATPGATPSANLDVDFYKSPYDGAGFNITPAGVGDDFTVFTKTFPEELSRPSLVTLRVFTFATNGYIVDYIKFTPTERCSGSKISMTDYNGQCYLTDGGRPRRYDGVGLFDVGIDAPTAPTIAAHADAGSPNGTYYAKVTYVNSLGAESIGGTASGSVTVSSKKIAWSAIPTGAAGQDIVSRNLYRTKAGGTTYYYVTTLSDNTTTTYTDNTADAALVTALDDTNTAPPNATIVYEHKNYMMYAVGNAVYFSKPGYPDEVPSTNYKQFPGNVLAMRSFQGSLVVGGDNFCHAVFGDIWDSSPTVDDTTVKVVSNSFGPVSHESMQLCNSAIGDILVFPTRKGLSYISQGFQENTVRNTLLSAEVQNVFDDATTRENMAGMYYNFEYILAMNYAGAETPTTTNNMLMKYDLRSDKWNPPIYYGLNGICEAAGMLLGGSSTAGIVYQLNSGYTDATADIHAVAVLSPLATRTKSKFSRARLRVNDGSTTTSLELKPDVDGVEGTIAVGAASTWSVATVSPKFGIPCPRGYEMQMTVEDDSTNDWIISAIEVDYEGGVM